MTLVEKQILFAWLLGKLLTFVENAGLAVTTGECYRTPQQAQWNAAHGKGIAKSLHILRLAIDLQCFRKIDKKWRWLKTGAEEEYRRLGAYWKSLHPLCAWGGDFTPPDPGHFSVRHDGRA